MQLRSTSIIHHMLKSSTDKSSINLPHWSEFAIKRTDKCVWIWCSFFSVSIVIACECVSSSSRRSNGVFIALIYGRMCCRKVRLRMKHKVTNTIHFPWAAPATPNSNIQKKKKNDQAAWHFFFHFLNHHIKWFNPSLGQRIYARLRMHTQLITNFVRLIQALFSF